MCFQALLYRKALVRSAVGRSPVVRASAVRRSSAFSHRLVILRFAVSAASGFFPTAVHCVDRRPGPALRLIPWNAAVLVAFLYVLSLPFLFVCVLRFVPAWHNYLLFDSVGMLQMVYRRGDYFVDGWQHFGSRSIFLSG